jgi:hypothetical protein
METYVVRLWLPDRPGALGAVASRIGAVRGDVIGIDILETGGGQAVDELVVRLPKDQLVGLLVSEIEQVDGVQVEFVRPVADAIHDPRLDGLETAAVLAGAGTTEDLLQALCTHGGRVLGAEWAAVIDLGTSEVRASDGPVPSGAWLAAFVSGSQAAANEAEPSATDDPLSSSDTAWAPLPAAGLAAVVGRSGTPFRARERRQVSAMARIVDTRFRELARLRSRLIHPSSSTHPGDVWPRWT